MTASSSDAHKRLAKKGAPVSIAIVTVSDSRTPETDSNGQYLREHITRRGHHVNAYHLVKDEPSQIKHILKILAASDAQVIIFNGGTGISPRDRTFDVLQHYIEKPMPGFGELFRMLSHGEVGSAAMLSRAIAGIYRGKMVFSTPGSNAAVRLAWKELIAPELEHIVWELKR